MTKEVNDKTLGTDTYGKLPSLTIGIVKDNADPAQEGRLKVFVPAVDSSYSELADLPWASYVSPFGGTTADFLVGREKQKVPGMSSYGMWAIPKNGAQVLIGFLDGNPQVRIWLGCLFHPELMRTLPQSINPIKSEIDESGNYPQETIPHYDKNLKDAGLSENDKHWKTRGGWERSVSHPSNKNKNKPTDDGYYTKPLESSKSDSQVVSITSPGRHFILMSDVDEHCRIRLKTTEGSQIILDDTNERIYISTAKGRNWVELDETNGKIYVYSDSKINIRSKNDINLYSDENINIVAKNRVNIQSEERGVKIQSKNCLDMISTHADVKVTASRDLQLKTINGPKENAVSEKEECKLPVKHLVHTWKEDGGSDTSRIRMESYQTADLTSVTEEIRFTAKESVHIKSNNSNINLDSKADTNIKSAAIINIEAQNNINVKGSGSLNIESQGEANIKGGSNIKISSSEFNVNSSGNLNLQSGGPLSLFGADIAVTSGMSPISGLITIDEIPIIAVGTASPASSASGSQSAKNADSAKDVISVNEESINKKMIRPDHESWDRDEEEEKCKTERNPKWKP